MAVRIKLDSLTQEHKDIIRHCLVFQPEQPGFFAKKRFATAKDPIIMYYVDKPNNEIVLPYTFANSLFGYHINSQIDYPPGKFNFINTVLLPHQVPIVETAMGHLLNQGTTTLGAPPGAGKTLMASYLASQLEGLVLVVSPLTLVKKGWITTFEKYTDAKIWCIDGKTPVPKECNVIITMYTMFLTIPKQILSMIRTLIIDEAHMFCTPDRIDCLLGTTPRYIIACTATPNRVDKMETIMQSVTGIHGIFIKPTKHYTVYKLMTGINVEIEKNRQGDSNWPKLVKDLAEHEDRNKIILDLVKNNQNHKIMILTWNKAQAYYLSKIINENGISSDVLAGKKSSYNDSKVLVCTVQKAGCGFDEAVVSADWNGIRLNMMLLTGSTKNVESLCQFVGRIFRADNPIIIDFVDDNSICKRHWNERRKWYEDPDQNGQIIEINYGPCEPQTTQSLVPQSMLDRANKVNKVIQ